MHCCNKCTVCIRLSTDFDDHFWEFYFSLGSIDEIPSEDLLANPNEAQNKNDSYFKCRKCR